MKVFDHYARYYDLLYRDKDYRGEADFIIEQVRAHAPGARSILELGCGTGIHAQLIAEAGYAVHGIDFSEAMLASAQARRAGLAPELQGRLDFSQGDVRAFRSGRTYDVVISLFHVFSYQTRNADLQAAFATAAEHLAPGGVLVFDYWYGPAVLAQRPETRVKRLSDGDLSVLRIAESSLDDMASTVDVNYETTVSVGETREVIRETHRMRYLFIPEIELLAAQFGFEPVVHQAWMEQGKPSSASWGAFSVLRKR
ncbi:SAM-dependent methyltransferase [Azospira sp. I13]|uniref:class I SAM-dependent DNA methyltransferase n=1 Tax=Azospira sp. I13 TaxID=1765050 RepID=UPI000D48EF2F|nr:class I SAM-dependent methyltransferase [Azospira sp. I13]GBG03764.1 SAM-dependent methyltransferase [Azospira sp. I13]